MLYDAAQLLGYIDLRKIHHRGTACADKVDMGFGVSVEAFHAIDSGYALDQSLLLKQRQIAVDRCQGNIRVLFLEHFVDHFR
jgi:hypothetical protein